MGDRLESPLSLDPFKEELSLLDQSETEQELRRKIAATSARRRERILQNQLDEIEAEVEAPSLSGTGGRAAADKGINLK